jgi:Anti-sigma factor NepR
VGEFEAPRAKGKPGSELITPASSGACPKKAASKSRIADQIGMQLRSIYDDVLAQPVPGRFLDLLRQLECTPGTRLNKDGM